MEQQNSIEIYQTADGQTRVDVRFDRETVWLSQAQMAELFNKDVRTVSEHLKNIYKEHELKEDSTLRKFRIVRTEGSRQVERAIDHYNLDAIISVGYRVIEIRQDLLEEVDGPMLQHGLKELHHQKIQLPRNVKRRPDPDRLERRFNEFIARVP